MSSSDEALVRLARAGDRAAFEELVRRTSRLVFARLYLETGDIHRAEDLLQETLLTAYRSIGKLTQASQFRPWLLTIAQNLAVDLIRYDHRQKRAAARADVPLSDFAGSLPQPDQSAQTEEMRQRVLAVLRSMPEEYRLPLTLRYLAGADYETISMQLGLTNGSLRGLLHRGLKLLRAKLPPEFGEEDN
jgi:RNA polymerase sigma-70 factor (ECF subfamily)